jgi:EmrB/QacA subfamily drug resistance transporter
LPEYKWTVFTNTTTGTVMGSIDYSIVLIALPTILKQLPGTGPGEALWIIMSYMLVTSACVLNFGRLGDMFGRVKTYNIGFAVFTVGSFLCSLSQNGLELVTFRIMQAIGSAFLFANSGALITDAFPLSQRGRALGMNQAAVVSGSIIGLVLGGILTTELGWRSIFWVNVPIGIFGTLWGHSKLRELSTILKHQKLDILGNIAFAGGLSTLLLGLTLGALESWSSTDFVLMGSGTIMLILFVYIESKVAEPMFDLSLFKLSVFAGGNLSGLVSGLARGAFILMMSFYLQGVLGDTPLTAGILLIPISAAVAITGPLSGFLSDKYGSFYFASAGLAVTGIAFIIMREIPAEIQYAILVVPLIVMGVGWGLANSPIRSETLSAVPVSRRGIGNAVTVTSINTGLLVSIAISILIISTTVPHSVILEVFGGGGLSNGAAPTTITDVSDFMNGLHNVYTISAILCFLGILPLLTGFRKMGSREKRQLAAEEVPGSGMQGEVSGAE